MNEPTLWASTQVHLPSPHMLRSMQWSLLQSRRLSKVSLGCLSPSTLSQILKKLTHALPHVQCLKFIVKCGTKHRYIDLHCLSKFHNLRELTVLGTYISVTFPEMSALETLAVCGTCAPTFSTPLVSVETLTVKLEPLESLNLPYFPRLKSLVLANNILKSELFTAEECHPLTNSIECLDMSYSRYAQYSHFEKFFSNLRILSLAHCDIPEWELEVILVGLKQLTELDLTG